MNLFRILPWFNRRATASHQVPVERRGGIGKRMNDATERVNNAVDELCRTVTMSRPDYDAMIERDRVRDVMNFSAFADACHYRYVNGDAENPMCRNPEHERICTGRETCNSVECPRLKKQGV